MTQTKLARYPGVRCPLSSPPRVFSSEATLANSPSLPLSSLPPVKSLSFFLLVLALLGGGCASSLQVRVDAINDPASMPPVRTYTLVSGSPDIDATSLQFRSHAALVRAALERKGYFAVGADENPALQIALSYGIGQPVSRTVTYSTPVYAEVGGGRVHTVTKSTDSTGKSSTTTRTIVVPSRYERVGNDITTSTYTYYPKYLIISARLADQLDGTAPEVWSASATLQSLSDDTRDDIPRLLIALEPYLGENTDRVVTVKLVARDGRFVPTSAR